MSASDDTLWQRSRAGDTDAFGLLFERHARAIYRYCLFNVGDWSRAEDLLSIVFLETWRRREKDLPAGKVLAWIYGIAAHVVRNQRRTERRYAAALKRLPEERPTPDFTESSQDRLDAERGFARALQLLARLSADEREVFVLCSWTKLSYDEAALALGIPIGTVRSRLARARVRLGELNSANGHMEDGTATISGGA
ncbi:MAG TPA: RNA polymerase sigma factor [Gaiellaceae bacterium]|nr:RNA polymerase sigma factor [Gaiellaceae bacterium]